MSELWSGVVSNLHEMTPAQYLTLVAVVSVACQWVAWRLRIPSLLILLTLGFALGQVTRTDDVLGRDVTFGAVSLAVGLILFEGSLGLRFNQIRDLGQPVIRLCTVAPVIAWPLITTAAWLVGFDIEVAVLAGAILIVTGPTVINPILRTLRPTKRVSSLLRWEGIIVDPIGAIAAVLVYQAIRAGGLSNAFLPVVTTLTRAVGVAIVIAVVLGAVLTQLMRHHRIPDFLHGVVFVSAAIMAQTLSNIAQAESGLLTVTIFGVYLANQRDLHLHHVVEFTEHLQVLFVGALFLVLAGRIAPHQVTQVLPHALVFVAVLILIVRPVSIWLSLWGTAVQKREKHLLAAMAPRGIVAAAVTSIFGLEFASAADSLKEAAVSATGDKQHVLEQQADRLARIADQANSIVPLVFLVIVITVAIYGLGIGRLAERLGLANTTPQGVLFAGMAPWVVDASKHINALGFPTLIVDHEYPALSRARMAGIDTENVSILSEYAVEEMDVSGIGFLIACTHDEETNATACRQFVNIFGRANLFQVRRQSESESPKDTRRNAAPHLSGREPFRPELTYRQLADRFAGGWQIKSTALTDEFTLADFYARYGNDAVVMFVNQGSKLNVVSVDTKIPQKSASIIAMVPQTTENA